MGVGSYSYSQGTFVATYTLSNIINPGSSCDGLTELDFINRINYTSGSPNLLTFALNTSQGDPLWMANTGATKMNISEQLPMEIMCIYAVGVKVL